MVSFSDQKTESILQMCFCREICSKKLFWRNKRLNNHCLNEVLFDTSWMILFDKKWENNNFMGVTANRISFCLLINEGFIGPLSARIYTYCCYDTIQ